MDWGEELEAHTLGGSSSSQCNGSMVMTLLAVDKNFLYFLSFRHWQFCSDTFADGFGSSSGMGLLSQAWIHEVSVVILRWMVLFPIDGFTRWLWCLPSAKGW